MRRVVVVAERVDRCWSRLKAGLLVRLAKTWEAGEYLLGPRKDVPHVVKKGETDLVVEVRQGDVRKPHLQVIEENGAAPYGITGEGIARPRLI